MSAPMKIEQAAAALGVSVSSLRRDISQGAPVARRGRRGCGGAALVSVEAVAAWRATRGPSMDAARAVAAGELASELPELLASAMAEVFRQIEGPHKRAMAGALAACWYRTSCAIIDKLRETEPAIPEISSLPPEIERLRLIATQ